MFSCDFGHRLAAGHSRKLVDPLVIADLGDPRSSAPLARFLANDKMPIREGGDSGKPAALSDETTGQLFHELARRVAMGLDTLASKPAPEIVFED